MNNDLFLIVIEPFLNMLLVQNLKHMKLASVSPYNCFETSYDSHVHVTLDVYLSEDLIKN